ncbi:hypothetical protein OSB04_009679 [Centaurea solstitialis]|uniref:Uncharacterized protein n=1 Tax=Centaurea solstitialis TaxID=347529 RepID=A0AA38WJX4_9ASTR|nr:hypothetical protein OSB04_009679 [Centaurea solstitialis]
MDFTFSFVKEFGNASCILFWLNNWVKNSRLCTLFPRLLSLEKDEELKVKDRGCWFKSDGFGIRLGPQGQGDVPRAQMKSLGSSLPQVLISKLSEIGILMLIPRTLAFKAVQRQIAASRSRRPPRAEQQGWSGGFPMTVPMESLSNLAQIPNFKASLGQLPLGVVVFSGTGRVGVWQVKHAFVATKKRRLIARKRVEDLLKAILSAS